MSDAPKESIVSWRTAEGAFARWSGYTAIVRWEYEDCLPKNLSDEEYKRMFPMSRVDGVRLFPYIEMETGHRYYLCAEATKLCHAGADAQLETDGQSGVG